MACRFPGGSSPGQLWDTLLGGKDTIQQAVSLICFCASFMLIFPHIFLDAKGAPYPYEGGFVAIDQFDPYPLYIEFCVFVFFYISNKIVQNAAMSSQCNGPPTTPYAASYMGSIGKRRHCPTHIGKFTVR
jgi:hypothetical protein